MEMKRAYTIGVDIGGTSVKLGLFTAAGERKSQWEIPTRKEENGCHILEDVAASVRRALKEQEICLNEVSGVGIGVPGPVDERGYVEVCVNLGWKDAWPARELSEMLDGVTVKVGNDANVAALGEQWLGSGRGTSSLVMLTLGTGVGGGVIMNNQIVAGVHGIGGELGHITVNPQETEACNCGNHGCLEQYASATGVRRVAELLLEQSGKESVLKEHSFSAKDVFDAAKAGDAVALQAVDTLGRYLGLVLANVSLTLDPEMFVIGGGVSRAGQILIDVIAKYYDRFLCLTKKRAKIILAELGNDAGICGAARMVL